MIKAKSIPFYDGYWYCYANSTAMMLGSIGESISTKLIEPLTGVGLGAMYHEKSGLSFFSGAAGEPDRGISKVLKILGFQFTEKNKEEGEPPFEELKKVLEKSTAVIGPLDMSFLDYNPDRPKSGGVDHFVLVYKIDGDKVFLNDPAGFANVFISFEQLAKAWEAESIGYKRGYYRYWANPVRTDSPSDEVIYHRAMGWFKELYRDAKKEELNETLINGKAIKYLVGKIEKNELKDYQINFLSGFALPLGVKRALDFGKFFERFNSKLSQLKYDQANLFGQAQSWLMNGNNKNFIDKLLQLAEIEDTIEESING